MKEPCDICGRASTHRVTELRPRKVTRVLCDEHGAASYLSAGRRPLEPDARDRLERSAVAGDREAAGRLFLNDFDWVLLNLGEAALIGGAVRTELLGRAYRRALRQILTHRPGGPLSFRQWLQPIVREEVERLRRPPSTDTPAAE